MSKIVVIGLLIGLVSNSVFGMQVSEDTIKIREVVVSSSRIEVDKINAPVSISIVSSATIRNHEESNILPVVAKVTPNVFVSETGVAGYAMGNGKAGQLTIRGVGGSPNAQVLTLVDGQPQYMGIFGHPLPNFHMASNVERVEVIRGPGSLIYGSNAMGGVINIISKQRSKDGIEVNGHLAYGSFNTFKTGLGVSYQKDKFGIGISYNRDQTDGHRDTSAFEMNNLHVFSKYIINDHWILNAGLTIADYYFEDPGMEGIESSIAFLGDISRNMLTFSARNSYENVQGGIYGFHNWGVHSFSDGWLSTDINTGVNFYEALSLWEGSTFTFGSDYKRYGGLGSSGMNADTNLFVNEAAVYSVISQALFAKLFVNGGLRYENNSVYGGELVPQLGLRYKIDEGTTIKSLFSKGFRSPTIMELYLFMPNPELKPERLKNFEFSLSQRISTIGRVEFTAFLIDGDDMITLEPNQNPGPSMIRMNTGKFRNKGIEIESVFFPLDGLRVDVNYSYLHSSIRRLYAPKNQLYIGGGYELGKFNLSLSLKSIGGLYSYIDADNTISDVLEKYQLLDAKIRYSVFEFMDVYLAGKNLLNQDYQTVYGYRMPGINLIGGLTVAIK